MPAEERARAPAPTLQEDPLTAIEARPEELVESITLADDEFLLRPIRPEDRSAHAAFLRRIAEPDLRRRFARRGSVSAEVEHCARIDPKREIALIAVRESVPDSEKIAGEVRAYRYPRSHTAEIAIMVRSDLKGRGLGRALMEKMVRHCRAKGLELIARILPENAAMIRLAERCGMQVEHPPGSAFVIAHMPRSA
jgi:acetyltransferase